MSESRSVRLYGAAAGFLLLGGVLAQIFLPAPLAFSCPFFRIFSIPCPTCGMTRALQSLFALDVWRAVCTQPLLAVVPLFGGVVFRVCRSGMSPLKMRWLFGSAVLLLGINWGYLIVTGN